MLIIRALYNLKSADFSWRLSLAAALWKIGLNQTMADPNVWVRAEMRPDGN